MKKFFIVSVFAGTLLFALFSAKQAKAAGEVFPGAGSGTLEDPYLVTNWTELNSIRGDLLSDNYKLINNLGTTTAGYVGIGDQWMPIGSSATPFQGSFNGNYSYINNLTINRPDSDYVGLFGSIGPSATVKNLGLNDENITGHNYVGGLVGDNRGYITKCYSSGSITGRYTIGGLSGGNSGAMASIVNSYSNANVTSSEAGLTSYRVGGLVGGQDARIAYSYSSGLITSGTTTNFSQIGGLLGTSHDAVVDSSFWDTQTSGYDTSAGGSGAMGQTTAQMGVQTNFTIVGWDFTSIWKMYNGYPHLLWEANPGYYATTEISTCQQLENINASLGARYSLIQDIDCYTDTHLGGDLYDKGVGFTPLGSLATPFTGIFNGNGHRIKNLYINRAGEDYVGLFGVIGSGGVVKNVGIIDADITGGNKVGILNGKNDDAEISSVYTSGNVLGVSQVGGLVGFNNGGLSNSFSEATTTSNQLAGGLVGENTDSISNSFSAGIVDSEGIKGGLVASSTGALVTHSFWNTESSTASTSAAGIGKTTSQLKNKSTFTDNSWDFDNFWGMDTNPQKNGGYPYLLWQAPFMLQYEASQGGVIDGPETQFVGPGISPLPVEAVPENHYEFLEWSDGSHSPARTENNVYGHLDLTASFGIDPNTTFTVSYTAGVGGYISGSANQTIIYNGNGTPVTALSNSGYRFLKWSDNSTSNPRTETGVSGDMSLTALFEVSGGGAPSSGPSGVGGGARDIVSNTSQDLNIGFINPAGINALTYINRDNSFSVLASSSGREENHLFKITNLDLYNNILTVYFYSEPKSLTLKQGEAKKLDLDGDKIDDVVVKFSSVYVNRVELTVKSLLAADNVHNPVVVISPPAKPSKAPFIFKRDLKLGVSGADVKELQKYLNSHGFSLTKSGPGSLGKETTFFGKATQSALLKFQKTKKIAPANGRLDAKTRAEVNKN